MKSNVSAKLLKIIPCQCQLGENILWHDEQQAIYWLDIESALLYRYFVSTQVSEKFNLPYRMGSFAFTPTDDHIIAAFAQGIARYNLQTTELEWLSQPERDISGNRFNDGRADRQGRFWAGTMVEGGTVENDALEADIEQAASQHAALYCLDHQLNCHKTIDNLHISNGLCWNESGDILYHADSPTHNIYQYDFCQQSASIINKRLFASTQPDAFPDGSTVDAQNHLWNAQWGSSKVVRYNSDGEIDFSITLPVPQPSCVAIGGPNLNWLLVTSAKQGLSKSTLSNAPLSGNVFIYQLTGVTGLTEPKCTV